MLDDDAIGPITERVDALSQGDLISTTHFVALGAPEATFYPDTAASELIPRQATWAAVARPMRTRWGVILTQTCDLVRSPDEEPWIQVAPLVDLGEQGAWDRAQDGKDLCAFALPRADEINIEFPAVGGGLSFPVEKAATVAESVEVRATPFDPARRLLLSMWLTRRYGRHAFPDLTENLVLGPLRREIDRRWKKPDSQPGAFVHSLLGLWATASESSVVEICFVMSPSRLQANANALPDAVPLQQQASLLVGPAQKAIAKADVALQIKPFPATMDGVSAQDLLLRMRQVDLARLPTESYSAETLGAAGAGERKPRKLGLWKDRVWISEDFDEPLPWEIQRHFEGRGG